MVFILAIFIIIILLIIFLLTACNNNIVMGGGKKKKKKKKAKKKKAKKKKGKKGKGSGSSAPSSGGPSVPSGDDEIITFNDEQLKTIIEYIDKKNRIVDRGDFNRTFPFYNIKDILVGFGDSKKKINITEDQFNRVFGPIKQSREADNKEKKAKIDKLSNDLKGLSDEIKITILESFIRKTRIKNYYDFLSSINYFDTTYEVLCNSIGDSIGDSIGNIIGDIANIKKELFEFKNDLKASGEMRKIFLEEQFNDAKKTQSDIPSATPAAISLAMSSDKPPAKQSVTHILPPAKPSATLSHISSEKSDNDVYQVFINKFINLDPSIKKDIIKQRIIYNDTYHTFLKNFREEPQLYYLFSKVSNDVFKYSNYISDNDMITKVSKNLEKIFDKKLFDAALKELKDEQQQRFKTFNEMFGFVVDSDDD